MKATVRTHRKLIGGLLMAGLLTLSGPATTPGPAVAADNPITLENQQPGTTDWGLGDLVADDVSQQIKGYASLTSVPQGGSLTLNVTVHPVQTYTIDVYRIGWYGGDGGRLELHAGPLTGVSQPACPVDPTTGMIACNWAPSYTMTIPPSWTSGVYMAVLTNAAGYQNYVNFVVRDGRPAPYLYQRSMNTAEAYNGFPDDQRTGKSLYEYNSYGANTVSGSTRAVKVSFDRPFDNDGSGDFFSWEVPFVRWLERSGYDVTYSTDLDTHENGSQLLLHKAFLSVGHDEYWSNEMRNAAETARDSGVNLAFFGANAVYWQVRFEASASGGADRVMVCYKDASTDPVQGPTTTVQWRNPPVKRPEQPLTGLMYSNETQGHVNAPYVVKNSSNWVYANSGFKDGDSVPGLVGYEADRYMTSFPTPPSNEVLLSQSPFTDAQGAANQSNSSIYQAASGAWVFASGTMSWSWALDDFVGSQIDPRIQQTTANILNRFGIGPAPVHDLKLVVPSSVTAGQAFSASVTAEDAQGAPVSSYNGTVHFSSTDTSAGVVLPADSALTNGQGTFSATLIRSGPQSLTVSDAANSLSTTANLSVIAGATTRLLLASGSSTTMAGSPVSFTVTAQDPYGNTDASYPGTLHFSTSDPAPVSMPADARLTSGRGSFSATLRTVGSQTITATDTASSAITGRLTVLVNPGAAVSIVMSVPGTVRANQTFSVQVTLKDAYGNVATGYLRTVHFSSSDMAAQGAGRLPADYTFTAADAGTHTFSMSLMTPPSQTITVADTGNASLSTTSRAINVTLF